MVPIRSYKLWLDKPTIILRHKTYLTGKVLKYQGMVIHEPQVQGMCAMILSARPNTGDFVEVAVEQENLPERTSL